MKRQLLTCCLAMCSLATMAQHDEWKNPEINAVNRAPMHTNYFAYSSEIIYLINLNSEIKNGI